MEPAFQLHARHAYGMAISMRYGAGKGVTATARKSARVLLDAGWMPHVGVATRNSAITLLHLLAFVIFIPKLIWESVCYLVISRTTGANVRTTT